MDFVGRLQCKVSREVLFKMAAGNKYLNKTNNNNWVREVNFTMPKNLSKV
jgi:hypothetical protein